MENTAKAIDSGLRQGIGEIEKGFKGTLESVNKGTPLGPVLHTTTSVECTDEPLLTSKDAENALVV
jgi:hypothetical protein